MKIFNYNSTSNHMKQNKSQQRKMAFLSSEPRFGNINKRADLTYNWIKDIQPKVLSAPSIDPRNRDYYNWIIGKPYKKMVFEKQKTYIPKSLSLEEKLNIPTYDKNQYHYKRPVNPYIGLWPSKPVYKSNVQPNYGYYPAENGNFYNIPSTIGKNQRYNSTWRNHNGYSFGTSGRFDVKQAISSGNVARMFEKNFTANSKYTNQPSWGYYPQSKPNSYYNRGFYVSDNQCYTSLSKHKKPKAVWR